MSTCSEAAAADQDEPGPCCGSDPEQPDDPDEPAATRRPVEVTVRHQGGLGIPVDDAWLQERLSQVVGCVTAPLARVSVLVVGDAAMRDLHRRHLGIDETTDVLTFPHETPDGTASGPIEADIAVCVDEARRQALRRGHRVVEELLLYAVHGLLHCVGYDDRDEAASHEMHREEDRILRAIAVGPVYGDERSGHDDGSSRSRRDIGRSP